MAMLKFNDLNVMFKYTQYACMRYNGISHESIKHNSKIFYNDNYDIIFKFFKDYYKEN